MTGEVCPDCGRESTHVPVPGDPGWVECAVCHAAWELDEPRPGTGPSAEGLPQWQADRLATLLDALGGIPLGSIGARERASLTWLCGFEADTVENIAAVMRRLTRRAEVAERKRSAAIDDARSRHLEADRYRRQLNDLCDWAGLDPEDVDDPYAALLAHLRGREQGGGS